MGTKQDPDKHDWYEIAESDEPMFTLLARDPLAPALVSHWAELRRMTKVPDDTEKQNEALLCAVDMDRWRNNRDQDVRGDQSDQEAQVQYLIEHLNDNARQFQMLVEEMEKKEGLEQTWLQIGKIHLQQGIMALRRVLLQNDETSF